MNPNAICPISNSKIDENVARLNAVLTVLFLAAYVLTNNIILVLFLFIDFFLRGAELSKFSPFAIFSKYVLESFKVKKKPINAGPKIFAARIGVIFNLGIVLFSLLGFSTVSFLFTLIFGLCALLEAAFGLCVACRIYPFVYKFTYSSKYDKLKV
ncbi:MAG: DUF4395 domain-containing protein [Bacteroidales bacterium]|nr:DUF4395 domain-containing protein [Bacteroidales bacterium]